MMNKKSTLLKDGAINTVGDYDQDIDIRDEVFELREIIKLNEEAFSILEESLETLGSSPVKTSILDLSLIRQAIKEN